MDDQVLSTHLFELEATMLGAEWPLVFRQAAEDAYDFQRRFDDLRVRIKYLRFDIEATRRENAHLREMIEGQGRR